MFDYHIHTSLSDDSDTPYSQQVERACQLGLSEIAITDHHDPDYADPDYPFQLDFPRYHEMLETAIHENAARLSIKCGLELGIQQSCLDKCRAAASAYPYDFIIGSFHMASGVPLDFSEFYEGRSVREIQEDYYTNVYDSVSEFQDYSVLGHLNLVDRYQHIFMPSTPLNPPESMELIREILKVIIYDGKGIEINTSTFRYQTPVMMPTTAILQAYRELGGEIITVGSDAHSPEYIAYAFPYVKDMLRAEKFSYVASFTQGVPAFHPLETW